MRKIISVFLTAAVLLSTGLAGELSLASACSIAAATGDRTNDGRALLWKNRDSWGASDAGWNCWQVKLYQHNNTGSSFGAGDRWGDRFKFTGVTDTQSFDSNQWINEYAAWAGVNEKGLGLVQAAAHNLDPDKLREKNYTPDQDEAAGMQAGQINFFILSRCETVNEVEQFLKDTNNGGGFRGNPTNPGQVSTARDTNCIIMVCDKNGDTATFEISGKKFLRDNVNAGSNYVLRDGNNYFTYNHSADYDIAVPPGMYSGIDFRTNFCRIAAGGVSPEKKLAADIPFYIDSTHQVVNGNNVVTYPSPPDGIHDWEDKATAVNRWKLVANRLNNNRDRLDYRIFMQKTVPAGTGINAAGYSNMETLARYIGDDIGSGDISVSLKPNRHVTTFSVVIKSTKHSDAYKGKLTTMWVALGEPSVSIFVPVFGFANQLPAWSGGNLDDMYTYTNAKRHQVYSYTNDNSTGQFSGRNDDTSIAPSALFAAYYGQGGIQHNTFTTENYYFTQYDNFIAGLPAGLTDDQLRTQLRNWQNATCQAMKNYYVTNTHP